VGLRRKSGKIPGFLLATILIAGGTVSSSVFASSHPKLNEAIDRLGDAQALIDSSDLTKLRSLLSQAIDLIQAEPAGPEWQGHRQAAVDLLQATVDKTQGGGVPSDYSGQIEDAIEEINSAITDADNFIPPAGPTATDSLDLSEDSDFRKISYVAGSSAQPFPAGSQFSPGPLMQTDNPDDVLHGKPVYFQMKTGNSVHFMVDSGRPLTKLVFTGRAFFTLTIEIKDAHGHPITGAGPFQGDNIEKMINIPLPRLTEFEIVVTTYAKNWLLIQDLHFEPDVTPTTSAP
jgi:hypothetical protein